MCTGLEIGLLLGGAALSAGGSYMANNQAQQQAEAIAKARNSVLNQTLARNKRIADDSRAAFDQRTETVAPEQVAEKQGEQQQERTAIGESAVSAPAPGSVPLSGSAPSVVTQAFAKRMGEAVDKGKTEAQQLGKLGSYGDFWFDQGVQTSGTGRELGVNQNLAGGNLALMPILQDYAEIGATKTPSPIPGIMMAAGQALGSYGGGRIAKAPMAKKPVTLPNIPSHGTGFLY